MPTTRLGDSFKSFDLRRNPQMRAAYERCQAVAAGREWCTLLSGAFGTGKTHLAIAALGAWRERHDTGYFWKVPDFLQWLRRMAFGGENRYEIEELTESYRRGASLVVLDDLGTENPSDWANEQLYGVLDSRYDYRLPTIITTNQDLERIDGRILSRFREGLVICEGKDMRRKGATS